MDTLLVAYGFARLKEENSRLLDAIRRYPCAKLSDSAFAINTAQSPEQVYERLSRYLDDDDSLYVITLSSPWRGQGPHYIGQLFTKWFG